MLEPWELYEALPKPSLQWEVQEVVEWLELNGLNSLQATFRSKDINGRKLAALTQQSIQKELKVSSKQAVRRLMEWADYQRKEFDDYCHEQEAAELGNTGTQQKQRESVERIPCEFRPSDLTPLNLTSSKENVQATENSPLLTPLAHGHYLKQNKKEHIKGNSVIASTNSTATTLLVLSTERVRCKLRTQHLRVTSINTKKEMVVVDSAKIGRQTTCEIPLVEDSVSRVHAQILRKGSDYMLIDRSKFGTFLENPPRIEVAEGRSYEFASQEIRINKLAVYKDSFDLQLLLPEQNNRIYTFNNRTELIIGRKSKDIKLAALQLDPQHSRLVFDDGKVYLENLQGGSYTRLQQSEPLKLTSCNIKVGCASKLHFELEYSCQLCSSIVSHRELTTRQTICTGKKSK